MFSRGCERRSREFRPMQAGRDAAERRARPGLRSREPASRIASATPCSPFACARCASSRVPCGRRRTAAQGARPHAHAGAAHLRCRPHGAEGGETRPEGERRSDGRGMRDGMRRVREAGRAKAARKRAAGRPASRRVRARSGSPGPERRPRCREGRAGPDRRPDSDRVAKRSLPSGIAKQAREGGKTVPDRGGEQQARGACGMGSR